MKILVCVKQVPEKDARLRVAAGDAWIVEDGLSWAISECDRYAVEAALRLKEGGGGEVVVLSLGGDRATKGVKEALAMGCDRAIHVQTDQFARADALTIAKVLAAAVKEESFDLVLTGQQSDDLGYNAVGQMLAARLGMNHVQIVLTIEPAGEGILRVSHELDNNLIETVEVAMPVVLGVQSGINDVRYASLKGIMQAGSKPQKKLALADLGLSQSDLAPKISVEKVGFPVKSSQAQMIEGDAKTQAKVLVEKLINEAKVL
jgi:electron transfer flavoprotein beta subunit